MADGTAIEWTDATWNVVNGCSVHSAGCTNCYAMRLAGTRLKHVPSRAGLTRDTKAGPVWTGEVRFDEKVLLQPLRWRRPRRIFVCAHGDLFHEAVPDDVIDRVFAVLALAPQHQFQVLTKRSARMREYLSSDDTVGRVAAAIQPFRRDQRPVGPVPHLNGGTTWWPLPNIWPGVSVEDQRAADERVPDLLATPAAVRWLSCEPLLGPIDPTRICLVRRMPRSPRAGIHIDALRGRYVESGRPYIGQWDISQPYPEGSPAISLDWIVVGGESGPGARPMHPDWARSLRDQCAAAGVPFLFKQWGEWKPLDRNGAGFWPADNGSCIRLTVEGARAEDGWPMQRIGKHSAGRLLDGRAHDAFPGVRG